QTQESIGLSFDRALRSMLRHDPDVMLVGEVRDAETAKIAINIALTGHLVLSTIHSNNAAGTFTRLLDMGIEPHFIASSLECVIAQSLVRVLCPHCKVVEHLTDQYMHEIAFSNPSHEPVYTAQGCPHCQNTGYRGRTAIHEVIVVDDSIRSLILKRAAAHEISRAVFETGVRSLRQSGFEKVRQGITSISEVLDASYD
ncbi:MAG: ATPase, T2SS/T4P/T4SS family, partial [Endomicrobiales bacterium]